ncbi:MAG TPA: DUF4251 domain-containing protein [Puia sp.]|nr:DUF4251 domain-containing protein [Puia sp.]
MKRSFTIASAITAICLMGFITALHAQKTDKQEKEAALETAIKNMVEAQRYKFIAQSMMPMAGRSRQVSFGYDLRVTKDTLNAYLPYVGKAFTADYGGSNGAISFKTTEFEYLKKDAKKGGWDITITPKNISNVRQIILRISLSGFTNVQVTSNTRDMISFYGYLEDLK